MRHFLAIEDFEENEILQMLDQADNFKKDRFSCGDCLKNKTLITMFMNPSTRTRTSFDLAITQLGGHVVTIEPGKSSWGVEITEGAVMDGAAEEHLKDAANVLSRYADFIALRAFPAFKNWAEERRDLILNNLAKWSKVPVINMETITHPAQALAMLQTIRNSVGGFRRKKFVLTWAYHPKPLNTAVANSAGVAAAMMGMDVVIAHPEGYDLDPRYTGLMQKHCQAHGADFRVVNSMDHAFDGADFVYAKSWGALTQYGNFQPEIHNSHRDWIVDARRMARTNNAFFSHCLPLRRNMIATDAVLDNERSLIYEEAENRLHVQKAVLLKLDAER